MDNGTVKALARVVRWRKMLEKGVRSTLEELAKAKSVNATYDSWLLPLTLLAQDIVEAILDGRKPDESAIKLSLTPAAWAEQRVRFGLASPHPK